MLTSRRTVLVGFSLFAVFSILLDRGFEVFRLANRPTICKQIFDQLPYPWARLQSLTVVASRPVTLYSTNQCNKNSEEDVPHDLGHL
jgi:hypothetical protein